jgi:hypothetical protein
MLICPCFTRGRNYELWDWRDMLRSYETREVRTKLFCIIAKLRGRAHWGDTRRYKVNTSSESYDSWYELAGWNEMALGSGGRLFWTQKQAMWFPKQQAVFWSAEPLLTSQEGIDCCCKRARNLFLKLLCACNNGLQLECGRVAGPHDEETTY